VRRELPGGYELDDDAERIDLDSVHAYLTESYWAKGRSREDVETVIRNSFRVVGLYDGDGRQIGFARTVSDGVVFAYLADVYVLPEFQGQGLGVELVRAAIEHERLADARWILGTLDAHGLYERFGFGPASERIMERLPTRWPL
jgi:predicted N-acetyltransferase YhbS